MRGAKVTVTGTIEKGQSPLIFIGESTVRILMSVRTLNVTYSQSGGTLLPGYLPGIQYFGTQMVGGKWSRDGLSLPAGRTGAMH